MAFAGSAVIIQIIVAILVLIPVLMTLGFLYYIFRRASRVKELEARMAELEKAQDRRSGGK
jgi:uncharacterized membrane protein